MTFDDLLDAYSKLRDNPNYRFRRTEIIRERRTLKSLFTGEKWAPYVLKTEFEVDYD